MKKGFNLTPLQATDKPTVTFCFSSSVAENTTSWGSLVNVIPFNYGVKKIGVLSILIISDTSLIYFFLISYMLFK